MTTLKCGDMLSWVLIAMSVFVYTQSTNGMGKKPHKPTVCGVTWENAEKLARDSIFAHLERQHLVFDTVLISRCGLVRRLDTSFADLYLFLLECQGEDTSLYGRIFVDSLEGAIIPYGAGFFPVHPESPIILETFYERGFPTETFRKRKPDKMLPQIWSLACATYNTVGYSRKRPGNSIYQIRGQFGCPIWWGTDADGNDYFVTPNGNVFEIFGLDPKIKKYYGHP